MNTSDTKKNHITNANWWCCASCTSCLVSSCLGRNLPGNNMPRKAKRTRVLLREQTIMLYSFPVQRMITQAFLLARKVRQRELMAALQSIAPGLNRLPGSFKRGGLKTNEFQADDLRSTAILFAPTQCKRAKFLRCFASARS